MSPVRKWRVPSIIHGSVLIAKRIERERRIEAAKQKVYEAVEALEAELRSAA